MFDFVVFSLLDALDITLVALLLYYIYRLLKSTVAINIIIGIGVATLVGYGNIAGHNFGCVLIII